MNLKSSQDCTTSKMEFYEQACISDTLQCHKLEEHTANDLGLADSLGNRFGRQDLELQICKVNSIRSDKCKGRHY